MNYPVYIIPEGFMAEYWRPFTDAGFTVQFPKPPDEARKETGVEYVEMRLACANAQMRVRVETYDTIKTLSLGGNELAYRHVLVFYFPSRANDWVLAELFEGFLLASGAVCLGKPFGVKRLLTWSGEKHHRAVLERLFAGLKNCTQMQCKLPFGVGSLEALLTAERWRKWVVVSGKQRIRVAVGPAIDIETHMPRLHIALNCRATSLLGSIRPVEKKLDELAKRLIEEGAIPVRIGRSGFDE